MKYRSLDALSSTAGCRIGCTFTPRENIAFDSFKAWMELPRITGTTGEFLLTPVFRPCCCARERNNCEFSRNWAMRWGSASIRRKEAIEAAAIDGGMPVANTNPGVV